VQPSATEPAMKEPKDLENLTLITGLMVRLLLHIPASVRYVSWFVQHPHIPTQGHYSDALNGIVKKYESLRGSAYTSQQDVVSSWTQWSQDELEHEFD
jgi:hypothetical protein